MVKQIGDSESFKKALSDAGSKLVVVDFFATWCGPCKAIAPQIENWSQEMDDVVFLKVDVDEAEDLAQEYSISCMPTFIFFKNGERVHEFSGASPDKLRAEVLRLK